MVVVGREPTYGDWVTLNSGGPVMYVTGYQDGDRNKLFCLWSGLGDGYTISASVFGKETVFRVPEQIHLGTSPAKLKVELI